jgi:hypothetical protein
MLDRPRSGVGHPADPGHTKSLDHTCKIVLVQVTALASLEDHEMVWDPVWVLVLSCGDLDHEVTPIAEDPLWNPRGSGSEAQVIEPCAMTYNDASRVDIPYRVHPHR